MYNNGSNKNINYSNGNQNYKNKDKANIQNKINNQNNLGNNGMNFDSKQKKKKKDDNQTPGQFKPKRHIPKFELEKTISYKIKSNTETIDSNETNSIKSIVALLYSTYKQTNEKSLSSCISEEIKNKLGGEWFVFASNKKLNISLNITTVSDSDFLKIDIGESQILIAKTK